MKPNHSLSPTPAARKHLPNLLAGKPRPGLSSWRRLGTGLLALILLTACNGVEIPDHYKQSSRLPRIYPDYTNVTIPVNIAPMSFELQEAGQEDLVARYSYGGDEIVCGKAGKAMPDIDDWHALAAKAKGKAIDVEVYARNRDGAWTRYKPFKMYVSPDSIDPYISYRLITPSYVTYEELTLNERCLENYKEQVMVDNMLCSEEDKGQCVNCHHYQNYNPNKMMFHARQNHGGTLISINGKMRNVTMKNDSTLSNGVYPAWHPFLNIITFSTNKTGQSFHTHDLNKIEVLDTESDLILYDIDKNEVSNVEAYKDEMEIFPAWSPDGKWLYYGSAFFKYSADTVNQSEAIGRNKEIKYSLYRRPFDLKTHRFGLREMVFDAAGMGKSATLPRVSPDGRFLLFTLGGWGCFHIWHHDADLWVEDLATRKAWPLTAANSNDAESFHNWSSNGRWIIFTSRRTDGNFTRPFFAHIDKDGHASKAFELPQRDPDYHRQLMKSYNVLEFMRGPVTITPQQFADELKSTTSTPAVFKGSCSSDQ